MARSYSFPEASRRGRNTMMVSRRRSGSEIVFSAPRSIRVKELVVLFDHGIVRGCGPLELVHPGAVVAAGAQPWAQRPASWGAACRHWQQQTNDTDHQQDDTHDVQVQAGHGVCRDGEPQDRAHRDQEEGRAGTQRPSPGRRPRTGPARRAERAHPFAQAMRPMGDSSSGNESGVPGRRSWRLVAAGRGAGRGRSASFVLHPARDRPAQVRLEPHGAASGRATAGVRSSIFSAYAPPDPAATDDRSRE